MNSNNFVIRLLLQALIGSALLVIGSTAAPVDNKKYSQQGEKTSSHLSPFDFKYTIGIQFKLSISNCKFKNRILIIVLFLYICYLLSAKPNFPGLKHYL